MTLTDREKEVLECMRNGWIKGQMPLYGGLCYQDVLDLLDKLGIDKSPIEEELDHWQQIADRYGKGQ